MPSGNPNPPNKWPKGVSGNPKGRPKKIFDARAELCAQLLEIDPNDEQKRTKGQVLVAKLIESSIRGSIRAANEVLDRLLGKPPQALAIADTRIADRDAAIREILATVRQLEQEQGANGEESGELVQ